MTFSSESNLILPGDFLTFEADEDVLDSIYFFPILSFLNGIHEIVQEKLLDRVIGES